MNSETLSRPRHRTLARRCTSLVCIGLIVAKIVRKVLTQVFKKIKLDDLLDKIGIGQLFGKMGVQSGPSEFLPKLIYFVILLFIIQVAAEAAWWSRWRPADIKSRGVT